MQFSLNLKSPVSKIPGVGPLYAAKLSKLGLTTVKDLLYYFPFRYDDLSQQKSIAEVTEGEIVTITAQLWSITKIKTRSGKTLIKASVNDGSGALDVIWFNQAYLLTVLRPQQVLNLAGKIGYFGSKLTLINPKYELNTQGVSVHTARLVPIYSQTDRLSSKWLRAKVHQLLTANLVEIPEFIPESILEKNKLEIRKVALKQIHFPDSVDEAQNARSRFAFEELLLLQLKHLKNKPELIQTNLKIKTSQILRKSFLELLPFELTSSQLSALDDLDLDISAQKAMNRLLQGEVGSGKTVVSAYAAYLTLQSGYKVAFMAPTEILVQQHYQTLRTIFQDNFKIALVSSSKKFNLSDFDLIIGTQALLNPSIQIENLGLVVVDEQQRFGVVQRQLLRDKAVAVNLLTMTATPIPRTLALTIYGQLDISTLDTLPLGRKKVRTYLVPNEKRPKSYDFIRKELTAGGQAFILCPLISDSESLTSIKSAEAEYQRLKKEEFSSFNIGLLHGKLKSKEKELVVNQFRQKKIDLLVTTAVVEVGIDIPNASIIVIEAAERFGLASLHQLRGRVGRGQKESFCFLFTEHPSLAVKDRLKLLEKVNSGLELSELDLKLRGAGDIFGTLQSGQIELKTAAFVNFDLITQSRTSAESLSKKSLPNSIKKELVESVLPEVGFVKD